MGSRIVVTKWGAFGRFLYLDSLFLIGVFIVKIKNHCKLQAQSELTFVGASQREYGNSLIHPCMCHVYTKKVHVSSMIVEAIQDYCNYECIGAEYQQVLECIKIRWLLCPAMGRHFKVVEANLPRFDIGLFFCF